MAKGRSAYQKCVASQLKGKHFRSRETQKRAFRSAAKRCKRLLRAAKRKGYR